MDVSLIVEAMMVIYALPAQSLVFGLKSHCSSLFAKIVGQSSLEVAYKSDIASIDVKKPSSAKGLLRQGFLTLSAFVGAHRCQLY